MRSLNFNSDTGKNFGLRYHLASNLVVAVARGRKQSDLFLCMQSKQVRYLAIRLRAYNIEIMARTTYYDVLEISKDAKLIDIKKAYRRLALK